jgi:hypothetical protein
MPREWIVRSDLGLSEGVGHGWYVALTFNSRENDECVLGG